ncbi:hypothetical protein [Saccharothrix texasensis]|uniref:Uncharacterized protein n=1 Tax=Saccharothrix texasensis TaxID=103734 RepID=A0A3N1GZJ4_9PSEU|nr:hypothetical protein [Saccharothrix texasensis]ROP35733.1 hypothetical protein EDD40_0984 [Saccharothrix texasensis]
MAVLALVLMGAFRFIPDRVIRAWRGSGTSGVRLVHYGLGAVVRLLTGIVGGAGILVLHTLPGTLGLIALIALVALAGGVIMGTFTWVLADWSREWRIGRSPRRIRVRARKIPDALVYGLGGGLLTGLGSAVLVGPGAGMLVAGGAVVVGMAVNLLDERAEVPEADRASSVLTSDRWATSLQLASLGVVVGLFIQFAHPSGPVTTLLFGVVMGIGAGLALGVTAAFTGGIPVMFPSTVWIRYLTAKWWLALGRHVPIRLLPFLDDACALGVMRRVGAGYQFRHIDLQRHFSHVASGT